MAELRTDADEVTRLLSRFDTAFERLEAMPGRSTEAAFEVIELLTAIYGTAIERIAARLPAEVLVAVADDELVGHLLALHGVHPLPADERIAGALADVRSQLDGSADARLDGVDEGIAKVTVNMQGCGSRANVAAAAIRDAVISAAPELTDVEAVVARPSQGPTLIPVDSLLHAPDRPR